MTLHDALQSPTWRRLARRLYVLMIGSVVLAVVTSIVLAKLTSSDGERFQTRAGRYLLTRVEANLDDRAALDNEIAQLKRDTGVDVVIRDGDEVVARSSLDDLASAAHFGPPAFALPLTSPSGHRYDAVARFPAPKPQRFALIIGALLVVLAAASVLFAATLAAPLAGLARAARAFGQGDLAVRVDERRAGPFIGLASVFNEMADKIKSGVGAERELLANVSHELRTPLSRIRVALELADGPDASLAKESLGEIATDLAELERIIDDVLTAARLDGRLRDDLPVHLDDDVAAGALVEHAAQRFRASHPDHPLDVAVDADLPSLHADATLLRRALDNVLDNAGKYSAPGARVSIAARCAADRVELEIVDAGIGIDAADVEKLFTPFFRAEKSRSKKTGGVGLGLVIVKRIVDAHEGTIDVVSEPDRGTRVTIRIPRAPAFTGVAPPRVEA